MTDQMRVNNCAVFLDRDGTINEDRNYLYRIEDFQYKDGVIEGLKRLSELGYLIFIITNQSGIARGYFTEEDYLRLNEWMIKDLRDKGVNIVKTFYCPHLPEGVVKKYSIHCKCRKPGTQLFWDAAREFNVAMDGSFAIGDRTRDLTIVNESETRGILISDEQSVSMDNVITCRDFSAAVVKIEEYMNGVDPWKS